ncbi:MAG: alpha-galactosidase, partial [Armatimonadetes bacterium]|nr:alpha-galactosidase [Candidatus Hippobium faecium]
MYSIERKNEFLQRLISKPKEHSLPNLDIKCLEHGWGEMEYNHGIDSQTCLLYGKECSYGIGIHVPGTIEIFLDGNYDKFSGFVGQEKNKITEVNRKYFTYEIILDGKVIWEAGKPEKDFYSFDVCVKGGKTLILKAYSPALDNSFGHIFWGDLTLAGSEKNIEVGRHISKEKPVFSFDYDGVCSDSFLADWDYNCEKGKSKEGDTYKVTYIDPETKLQVVLDVIDYEKDGAVWWDYSFKNLSGENSKQISNIRTLSANIFGMNKPVLKSAKGSDCKIDDFRPISFDMKLNEHKILSTNGGRSTNGDIPYFNLSCDNKSIVGALGWSGQWVSDFVKISDDTVVCSMGIIADTYLYPNEEIKVPSMCLVFSDGEFEENQNDFRKFLVDYIIPRDEKGEVIPAPICVMGWGGMKTDEYEKRIDAIKQYNLPYEYYWVDAGWYGPADSYSPDEHQGDWAIHVGDWEVNPKAHPKGLRYLSDRFSEIGLKFLLWIEIERAISDTPVVNEHPEYWLGVRSKNSNLILNIADDKACDWVID